MRHPQQGCPRHGDTGAPRDAERQGAIEMWKEQDLLDPDEFLPTPMQIRRSSPAAAGAGDILPELLAPDTSSPSHCCRPRLHPQGAAAWSNDLAPKQSRRDHPVVHRHGIKVRHQHQLGVTSLGIGINSVEPALASTTSSHVLLIAAGLTDCLILLVT